jgi:two-component system phosphate regulon sensor histidine kinase PhoR
MFKRLRWKLTATYIGLVILAMLVMGAYLFNSLENYFYNNLKNRLETQVLLSSRLIEENLHNWDLQHMEVLAAKISSDLGARVTIINLDGHVLGDSQENATQMENHLNRPEVRKAITDGTGMAKRYSSTLNSDMMYVAVNIYNHQEHVGFVRLALPLDEVRQALFNLWSAVLMAILLAVLITAPVSLGLGKKVTEPVERLIDFTRHVAQGDFGRQARVSSDDELGELASTLNHMAATINEKVSMVSEGKSQLETVLDSMISGVIFIDHHTRLVFSGFARFKFGN